MNEAEIKEILSRGIDNVYPNLKFVEEALKGSKSLTFYWGVDPTGPTLHIGHAIVMRKLQALQKGGHKIILLIGDFTAGIGDPTGKDKTRKPLSETEIKENYKNYKKQASTFLNFEGSNPAIIRYNSEWLSKLTFPEILELASHVTVEQMLKRDMFDRRIKNNQPISLHEFMYPLLQAYDSVAMEVDGELGANDQTFNILMGRQLEKQILNKEKIVILTKLLTDASGNKMGKSEGNMVKLDDDPNEMFGKVMSWTDGMILPGFELCTDVSDEELKEIEKDLKSDKNRRDLKERLGKEIVKIYYGEKAAEKASTAFSAAFQKGGIPDDIETVNSQKGEKLADIFSSQGIVKSKTEFTRLIGEGAVSIIETGEKIKDKDFKVIESASFKVGKKRFLRVVVK